MTDVKGTQRSLIAGGSQRHWRSHCMVRLRTAYSDISKDFLSKAISAEAGVGCSLYLKPFLREEKEIHIKVVRGITYLSRFILYIGGRA